MKVVVVDRQCLPAGVEFPPLAAPKYGWEEYPGLDSAGMLERCWRTDVVVALNTLFDPVLIDRMPKLGLLVLVGNACPDGGALAIGDRIVVRTYPHVDIRDPGQAQTCCDDIVAVIDQHIAGGRD